MARPKDPIDDVVRCAELIRQAVKLARYGYSSEVGDIFTGLADRLDDCALHLRAGTTTDADCEPVTS